MSFKISHKQKIKILSSGSKAGKHIDNFLTSAKFYELVPKSITTKKKCVSKLVNWILPQGKQC